MSIGSSWAKVQPFFELGEKVFPLFSTCFPLFSRSIEICEKCEYGNHCSSCRKAMQCTASFSTCSLTRSYKLLNSEKENSASSFFLTFLLIGVWAYTSEKMLNYLNWKSTAFSFLVRISWPINLIDSHLTKIKTAMRRCATNIFVSVDLLKLEMWCGLIKLKEF